MTPPNIDLKALWQQQTTTPPTVQVVLKAAQQFQKKQKAISIVSIFSLLFTCVLLGGIWWFFQPDFLSTKIGITLTILAMFLFVGQQSSILSLLLKENHHLTNKEYLLRLQQIQQKKTLLQTYVLTTYFIVLSIGIALYLYEYTLMMPRTWAVACYGITGLWIAFNWWYLRPRIIKKQQKELDALQTQFKALEGQLEE